ncbi:MAG: serine hydrolase [Sphingomonadaceae bacterium]|nr:serine hydrolase [Sphingomonadaceae bacterium]
MARVIEQLATLGLSLILAGCAEAQSALSVPTAMAAHEICSSVFVSRLDSERAFTSTVGPQLGPLKPFLRMSIDPVARSVTASLGSAAARRAVYQGAYGCIVSEVEPTLPVAHIAASPGPSNIAEPTAKSEEPMALSRALDLAFAENPNGPRRRTYAAVIVHDGKIVAERYARGMSATTPLHGWSMSKSMTNALLGVLVQQGRLDMFAPAPASEWRDQADPRHAITADDLLRMRSGLDVGQSLTSNWSAPFDPANQIMFAKPNMAAAAASRPLKATPRTVWTYSDGNTAILGRLIRERTGGPLEAQVFARRELFDRLGMGPVTLETDASGSPIGATQIYASARDWARLGQLFLDNGLVAGHRVLPDGWVNYSTSLTPGSERFGYGAGFWISRPLNDQNPRMPAGSFMARGARGQYVVVVPSARLVVVKLGDADTPRGDFDQMAHVVTAAARWEAQTND